MPYVARIDGAVADPIARLCICRCSCMLAEPFDDDDDDEVVDDGATAPLVATVVAVVAALRSM